MLADAPITAVVPADSLRRAKAFYEQTLGLVVRKETEGAGLLRRRARNDHLTQFGEEGATRAPSGSGTASSEPSRDAGTN